MRDLQRAQRPPGHLGQELLSLAPVRVAVEGLAWDVDPGELPPERADAVRDVLARIARGQLEGEVVKLNPARRVLRAGTPLGELYVKTYFTRGPLERAKHLFVPSKARSEFDAMRRLRAAGVATAVPLAMCERRRSGFLVDALFAAHAVPGARSFARVLDEVRARSDDGARRALLEGLAELACALARAGADHRDLHVGNVLLDAEGRATIIDLHACGFPARLDRGRRFERLARLALSLGSAHPERQVADWAGTEVRWLAAVAQARDPDLAPSPAALAAALEARAAELLSRHLASRDRRCVVDSKSFAVEGPRSRRVYRRRDVEPAALEAAIAAPARSVLHRHARGRSVLELVAAPPGLVEAARSPDLVRKREELPGLRSRLGALVRGTRTRKAWLAARALDVRGIPAPRALALVEERTLGVIPGRSFLLMEHLADTTMVHVYLQERLKDGRAPGSEPPARRRELARALGRLVARLHRRGLVHRDLAVQNVLLRPRPDGGFDLWLVDLDEVRVRSPSEREALRALVQVADLPREASRADLLRGLRAYLEDGGAPAISRLVEREGERALVQNIARALAQRAQDKRRRMARRAAARPS